MRAYAKEHVGLTRAVFELYRGVFSCFVVMQASALSVGQRLLFIAETKEQCNKKGGSHYDLPYFAAASSILIHCAIAFVFSCVIQIRDE